MLWVGNKQRSSGTLTTQHQALLGCLPHRLFVGLAQVNQLLDALLGLHEKGQGDEFWLSGLEQEHSQVGKAAQGAAAPWCRKAPRPLSSLLIFPLSQPPPAATAHLGHPQLSSPRSRRLCRCVQSHWPHVFPLPLEHAALLPPPHIPHLQAAQRRTPCHTCLHLLILQLLQEAHEGLGKMEESVPPAAAELGAAPRGLWHQPSSSLARPARTRWRKRGFSARLRSWADTALTTLLLPSTRSRLSAFSPSFFRRPSGMRFRARSTTSWSSELRFCASSAAGSHQLSQGVGSHMALPPHPCHPSPGHPGSTLGRGGPTLGASVWSCSPRHCGPTAKIWEGSMGLGCTLNLTCPPQGWLSLGGMPQNGHGAAAG